jgi:hypothetical protein
MATSPPSDDVLVLHPSKRKWIAVTLLAAAFTAAGVWIVDDGAWLVGVVVIAFFGPCTCVGVWTLIPGNAYLRLDPAGLAARTPFRTLRYSWDEIDNFRVHTVVTRARGITHTTDLVAFDRRGGPVAGPLLRSIGGTISPQSLEVDAGLPDTYGRNPGELARLLQGYRDRYATDAGAPGDG